LPSFISITGSRHTPVGHVLGIYLVERRDLDSIYMLLRNSMSLAGVTEQQTRSLRLGQANNGSF